MRGDHLDDRSQTQREIIVDELFEGRNGATIAVHRRIRVNTGDTHREAAFDTWRDSITTAADLSSTSELPEWYGRIEETRQRYAARPRRRASNKKENRSTSGGDRFKFEGDRRRFEGDRCRFEGDRCKSRGDAEKNARARDVSVAIATKS